VKLPEVFHHYIGVCVVLIVAYFCLVSPFIRMEETVHATGNQVSITQPMPSNKATQALDNLANAVKERALADALAGKSADLSAAQQTVANAISAASGADARLAGALAAGLTKPSPKVEVVTVSTKPTASTSATAAATDSEIAKALKGVLADPNTKVHVETNVTVSWQDKPFSPIFTAYASDGSAGAGLTLKQSKYLDLDALVLANQDHSLEVGPGVEHIFKGTSAGIGADLTYNFHSHAVAPGVYATIHF